MQMGVGVSAGRRKVLWIERVLAVSLRMGIELYGLMHGL